MAQYAQGTILPPEEVLLLRIKIWESFSELPEHFLQVQQVLLESAANHDHIIQVYETWLMRPLKMVSINLSNVAGALQRPKGMTRNCHSPWPIKNAVFSLSTIR
jgi:hypothetical protein